MPELKRIGGILIYLMYNDTKQHNMPHVHVLYGEFRASISLEGNVLAGTIPSKQLKIVQHWLSINYNKVLNAWTLASQNKQYEKNDT